MNAAQEALMSELCVRLGFCLTPEKDWNWFAEQIIQNSEDFARAVYEGEGLDYEREADAGMKVAVRELGARYLAAAE